MQGDETARREDKETEDMESGDEEPAAAEAPVMEDEGIYINHCMFSMTYFCCLFPLL